MGRTEETRIVEAALHSIEDILQELKEENAAVEHNGVVYSRDELICTDEYIKEARTGEIIKGSGEATVATAEDVNQLSVDSLTPKILHAYIEALTGSDLSTKLKAARDLLPYVFPKKQVSRAPTNQKIVIGFKDKAPDKPRAKKDADANDE
jgi:hypothetical protein